MIDIEKKKRLIAISLQAKAYADVYKYASEVIEADPDDGYAWAMKGVAAANTFDINASKINEALVFVNTGIDIGIDDDVKKLISAHFLNAFEFGTNEINKSLKSRIVDYQKVAAPAGGSTLIHMLGQSVNKITVAKEMAPSISKYTTLLPITFRLHPINEVAAKISKYFTDIELHSKDLGEYLKDSDPGKEFYEAKAAFFVLQKEALPGFVSSTTQNPKKEGCFIATAAAGSYHHPKVYSLRLFRDVVLSKSPCGRAFVKKYYKY